MCILFATLESTIRLYKTRLGRIKTNCCIFPTMDIWLILSNLPFLLPAVKSAQLHRFTRAAVYFLMMLASGFYHTCNSFASACVFEAQTHRKIDFFFAQLIIPVTALYIVKFAPRWHFLERWLIILFAVVIFVVELVTEEPFVIQLIVGLISVGMIAIYWTYFGYRKYQFEKKRGFTHPSFGIPNYDWEPFSMGICLSVLACSLFATQKEWHIGYWAIHSVWHTLAAFGQYYILCIRDAAPRFAALDKSIPNYETVSHRLRTATQRDCDSHVLHLLSRG